MYSDGPMIVGKNRRRARTRHKKAALALYLKSRLLRLGMKSIVLGTSEGLLLAWAGKAVDPDMAAAFAPFIFHELYNYPERVEGSYFVDALPYAGGTLYLFCVGARDGVALGKSGAPAGIRRILDEEV